MLEYIAPMKIALIALVILSVIVILGLIVFRACHQLMEMIVDAK